jgi:uncharacterized protein (TIGR03067 family)
MRMLGLVGLFALGLPLVPAVAQEKGKLADKLLGTWTYVSGEKEGKKIPAADLEKGIVKIDKKNITLESPDGKFVIKYALDATTTPARIDMEIIKGPQGEGAKSKGIVALDNEHLKICYPAMGGDTPKDFATKAGTDLHLFVLKRKK